MSNQLGGTLGASGAGRRQGPPSQAVHQSEDLNGSPTHRASTGLNEGMTTKVGEKEDYRKEWIALCHSIHT